MEGPIEGFRWDRGVGLVEGGVLGRVVACGGPIVVGLPPCASPAAGVRPNALGELRGGWAGLGYLTACKDNVDP